MKNYFLLSFLLITSVGVAMQTTDLDKLKKEFRKKYNAYYPYLQDEANASRPFFSFGRDKRMFIPQNSTALFSEYLAEQIAFRDRLIDIDDKDESGNRILIISTRKGTKVTLKEIQKALRLYMASYSVLVQKKGSSDMEHSLFLSDDVKAIDNLYGELMTPVSSPDDRQT